MFRGGNGALQRNKEQLKDGDPILRSDSSKTRLSREQGCKIVAYTARLYSSRSQSCSITFILTLSFTLPHSWQLRRVTQVHQDLSIEIENI